MPPALPTMNLLPQIPHQGPLGGAGPPFPQQQFAALPPAAHFQHPGLRIPPPKPPPLPQRGEPEQGGFQIQAILQISESEHLSFQDR